ncbi:MAG TPA: DUF1499 domain-containing protein [Burkholderiales bacterium]|nr:DUF1499 domain-containing protein [Burkholderiales bacterium]
MFSGRRPDNLGVTDGRLTPCRPTPNCVSSQADPTDARHYVAPLAFAGSAQQVMAALRRVIEATPRATVIRQAPNYLYAEFRSRLLGFVDDVEFICDEKSRAIHVRSASRLGHSDFGVNRARVEAIRARLGAVSPP